MRSLSVKSFKTVNVHRMTQQLSPKQVARAIGVSESSLKRWCDQGLLPMVKTAGGHRRLALSDVLEFVRESGRELAQPEVLGLPAAVGQGTRVLQTACEQLTEALIQAEEAVARQIVLDLHLQHHRVSVICDEVIAPAFYRIGERWECGSVDVYQERSGCEIIIRILHELSHLLPTPTKGKRALGGTCEGDIYQVPTCMVELVLRQCGFQARSLGCNLPIDSLIAALTKHRPDLFWLSVSYITDEDRFLKQFHRLYQAACEHGVPLAVGGQALTDDLRRKMQYTVFGDTLQHLESYLGVAPATVSAE